MHFFNFLVVIVIVCFVGCFLTRTKYLFLFNVAKHITTQIFAFFNVLFPLPQFFLVYFLYLLWRCLVLFSVQLHRN